MRDETIAGLRVRITGGTDREGGGGGPLVVLLHGFGAPGEDLVPLWRQLDVPAEVRFAFPAAPIDLAASLGRAYAGGRAWWLIDPAWLDAAQRGERTDRSSSVPDGLHEARARVLELLPALQEHVGATHERTVLGGFSQGAMLSVDVATHLPAACAGLVLMSGSVVALDEWRPGLSKLRGVPVVQSHGRADPILPFDAAVRLHALLEEAGAKAHFIEFAGGHTIPSSVLDALGALVRNV